MDVLISIVGAGAVGWMLCELEHIAKRGRKSCGKYAKRAEKRARHCDQQAAELPDTEEYAETRDGWLKLAEKERKHAASMRRSRDWWALPLWKRCITRMPQ